MTLPAWAAELWQAMTSWTGIALFGIGFLAGIAPTLAQWLRGVQVQPTADLGASMAQAIQAMIPLMMFAMMMQMFMGMFRMPMAMARGVY